MQRSRREHAERTSRSQSPSIDVNQVDSDGWSALRRAVAKNDSEICRILCAAPGIDANTKDFIEKGGNGWTPLHSAAAKNCSEVVSALTLCPFIDVNSKDKDS